MYNIVSKKILILHITCKNFFIKVIQDIICYLQMALLNAVLMFWQSDRVIACEIKFR